LAKLDPVEKIKKKNLSKGEREGVNTLIGEARRQHLGKANLASTKE